MKFDKFSPNLLSGIISILFGIFIYYKIPTEVEKPVLIFGQTSSEIDPQIVPTIIALMFLIFGLYTVFYEKDSKISNSWPKFTKKKRLFDRSDFAVLKHPIRKSFLDELIDWYLISVIKQKDFKSIINLFEQYNYDYNAHLCPHLYCIWRSDNISNRDFSKQWWKNYNIFKLRDQLLFSLTLQQKLYSPSIIAKDNFTNKINHFKTYQKNKKKVKNIFEIVANVRNLTPKNLSFSLDTLKWRKIESK